MGSVSSTGGVAGVAIAGAKRQTSPNDYDERVRNYITQNRNQIQNQALVSFHRTVDQESTPTQIPPGAEPVLCECNEVSDLREVLVDKGNGLSHIWVEAKFTKSMKFS